MPLGPWVGVQMVMSVSETPMWTLDVSTAQGCVASRMPTVPSQLNGRRYFDPSRSRGRGAGQATSNRPWRGKRDPWTLRDGAARGAGGGVCERQGRPAHQHLRRPWCDVSGSKGCVRWHEAAWSWFDWAEADLWDSLALLRSGAGGDSGRGEGEAGEGRGEAGQQDEADNVRWGHSMCGCEGAAWVARQMAAGAKRDGWCQGEPASS